MYHCVCESMHHTETELYTLCSNKSIYKLKLEYVFFSAVNTPTQKESHGRYIAFNDCKHRVQSVDTK